MNAKRMIAVLAVLVMAFAVFAFAPVAEDDAADKDVVIFEGGELTSTLSGTSAQKVIIQKDMTIKGNGHVLIEGELSIPAGVTVTIEGGDVGLAQIDDGIFVIKGSAEIDGNIVSKVKDGLYIQPESENDVVTINGSITALGDTSGESVTTMWLYADVNDKKIVINGDFIVGSNTTVYLDAVVFAENSALTVLGKVGGYVYTAGLVTIDGATDSSFIIYISEASAVVNIIEVTGLLSVMDWDMYAYTDGAGIQHYVNGDDNTGAVAYDADRETFYTDEAAVDPVYLTVAYNRLNLTNVENVCIRETVTTAVAYDKVKSENKMYAETKMILEPLEADKPISGTSADAKLEVEKGKSVNFETMTLDDVDVSVNINYPVVDGKAIIAGDVTYSLQDVKSATPPSTFFEFKIIKGTLEVTGMLVIKKGDIVSADKGTINAAHYTVKDADNNTDNIYTTVQRAIDNGATDIDMMYIWYVKEDITIPAGVKVTTKGTSGFFPIAVVISKEATLTVSDGAEFVQNGIVIVFGKFIIENMDYGITFDDAMVMADTIQKKGAYLKIANLKAALAEAKSGDVINALKPDDYVRVNEDMTIPAGVTFDAKNKNSHGQEYICGIMVENGCTLTVEGELLVYNTQKLLSQKIKGGNDWNTVTPDADGGEMKDYSVVKVRGSGTIVFDYKDSGSILALADLYSTYKIPGAYYYDDQKNETDRKAYISEIAPAFDGILDTYQDTVYICGDVTIDNMKVSGTEKERFILVIADGSELSMKNFSFSYGKVIFEDLSVEKMTVVTGDIGTSTGRISFSGEGYMRQQTVFEEQFINDSMNLVVRGLDKDLDKDYDPNADDIPSIFGSYEPTSMSGTVFFKDIQYESNNHFADLTKSDMIFTVPSGSHLYVLKGVRFLDVELRVAGDLTVTNKGSLMMNNYDTTLSVTGTFTAERSDGSAASVQVINMIVGGTAADFGKLSLPNFDGTATVSGAGTFENLYKTTLTVFNGATVTADALVEWMSETHSTEFYMDGVLIDTMYAGEGRPIPIATETTIGSGSDQVTVTEYNLVPAIQDAKFIAWQTYDEKSKTYKDVPAYTYVGAAGFEKVYADISRSIYDVTIVADVGIDDIFIDGKIILKDKTSNTFTEKVSAGAHTISYTLSNGYSGNASIVAIDGKTISGSGLTFVIDDDKAGTDMKMEITVSGITKSGYDTDPETHDEKASGLTTTEILLIVAVIIMAVMAVVLILRLNRS